MLRTKKTAVLGVAIAGALLLGACSSDDNTSETSTGATTGATTAATAKPSGTMATAEKNIVEIAAGNPDFSTLVSLVTAAGLAETLAGPGPFTVFAPTNEAFAKLDPATVADLQKPENKDKLVAVLTYHVVPGDVMAKDVKPGDVKTVNGAPITVTVDGSTVKLNGTSTVVKTDIEASNGVIHVIDTVLLPPAS